jgi:hypothetical protein
MGRKIDIKVVSGVSSGDIFHFTLDPSKPLVIGRDHSCGMVLQDPYVSRKHAVIEVGEDGFYIADQGSGHGTVHMGFQLRPGPEGKRRLGNGDEFKVGDTIFSVHYKWEEKEDEDKQQKSSLPGASSGFNLSSLTKGRYPLYLGLLAILLLLLLIPGGKEKTGLPPQDNLLMPLPEESIKGYWPLSGNVPASLADTHHLDKARFGIPAADLVIEYEYMAEAPIEVYIDETLVETLKPSLEYWQKREIVVRDIAIGKDRILTFDNTDYPKVQQSKGAEAPLKQWRVRNIRHSPIIGRSEASLDTLLNEAMALASRVDTTPDSLFLMVRGLQKCIIEALTEASFDAVDYIIDMEAGLEERYIRTEQLENQTGQARSLSSQALTDDLKSIIQRRTQKLAAQFATQQLEDIVNLTSKLEAELWRRVNSRIFAAEQSARAGNFIVAHDHLKAVKSMFSDEADYRWLMADRKLNDDRIVPKKIRLNPEKFRSNLE